MKKYIIKKILLIIPTMILISFLVFVGLQLVPVDPITYIVPPDMAANVEQIDKLRVQLGLDKPIIYRYFKWLIGILKGDFGYSIVSGTAIKDIIKQALPATFILAFTALIFSTIIGIAIGILAAIKQNSIVDNIVRFFSVLAAAIPSFFFGILLLNIFAIKLQLFPISGRYSSSYSSIRHLVLPSLTLSLALVSAVMRYTRNSILDICNMPYVKTARAKGISEFKVYFKHILKNALRPILVLLIFRLPILVGGSVIIENIFAWPGISRVILEGITAGDYPVIMMTTLMVAFVMLACSLIVDIVMAILDPRIRY